MNTEPPTISQQTAVSFGENITLVGYDLVESDGTLQLDLHWHALAQPTTNNTLFVHLRDNDGNIIGLYLLIGGGYSLINPIFEAPDENLHFFTTHYIKTTGRLPIVDFNDEETLALIGQEAAQPPLYYLLTRRSDNRR